jgi:hypothetical protein
LRTRNINVNASSIRWVSTKTHYYFGFRHQTDHLALEKPSSLRLCSERRLFVFDQKTNEQSLPREFGGKTMTQEVNRQDQIVHRFYLKTVGVLVDGRLTHHGVGVSKNGGKEPRVDKWVSFVA